MVKQKEKLGAPYSFPNPNLKVETLKMHIMLQHTH